MTPPATSRRLLVLVHEFPPAGGAGVQRIAKFCKFLPEFGWEPEVITTTIIEGRPTDPSLVAEVAGVPVLRLPHRDTATGIANATAPLKRLLRGRGRPPATAPAPAAAPATPVPGASDAPAETSRALASSHRPMSARVASWVAVPDGAARWADSAVRAAAAPAYDGIQAVLASGPPHSTLVAGARIAKARGVPFVADMRDAWADYPGRSVPTPLHRARSESLEREVMTGAASVVVASQPFAEEAARFGATNAVTITNGYDPDDIPARPAPDSRSEGLALAFMGRFYASTDPATLFAGIATARAAGLDVTLDVVGPEAPTARDLAERLGLGDAVRFLGYRPHAEALEIVARADVAVLTLAEIPGTSGIYPGKLFEYLGMGMPVLLVGPVDGVSARLIEEAGGGEVVSAQDGSAVAETLRRLAEAAENGSLAEPDRDVVSRFERRALTARLADVLDSAVSANHE